MRLEKRILQLEKQVLLLKAKIKANDLWKQEIQSWIYKTFKRSIVEKLIASDSGDSNSDNDLSEDVDPGSDMEVEYFPASKKLCRFPKSKNVVKRRKPRPVPVPVVAVATASSRTSRESRAVSDRSNDEDSVAVAISKARIASSSESSPTAETKLPIRDTSISMHSDEIESESTFFDQVEVDDAIVEVRTAGAPEAVAHSSTSSSAERSQPEDHQPSKNIKLKQSPTGGKTKGLVEIRADLKKYFEYWPNPNKPGEYKLACLIEGCNSKLSMHPSNRWANSARHLGGAHQIREYMPASSLSAQGTSKQQDNSTA